MKNKISMLILLGAGLTLGACKKELQAVNVNPNALEQPDATTLLSNTIVAEFYNNANIVWTLGNGYDQYMTFSSSYYNQSTRYFPVTNEPYWIAMYESARDANTLYTLGQTQNNPLLQAAGLTLRSYAFAQLTELWGDIPFTNALKGSTGTFTPSYDNQQVVYTDPTIGILPSLKRADSLLKANPNGVISGDMLYSGNSANWRALINALRVRYLMRISSKVDPSTELQSIVADNALMTSNSQSAALTLPTAVPYNFVSLTERAGDFAVKFMNATLYNAYVATGDSARIAAYFATSVNTPAGTPFSFNNYGGMPMVVDASTAQANASSLFNTSFQTGSNAPLIKARIMTYAEQEFGLAEAAMKGYVTTSTPDAYYNAGVLGAYAEIGLSTTQANNYLSHNVYNATTGLNQIITQKWLVNINNAFEGWIEYRRTGIPAFDGGGAASLNNGVIPSRFTYPVTEQSVNSVNYNAELKVMGGTDLTTYKAWWEK
jgi:hypothetical protein